MESISLRSVEMHTAGEPLRIIHSGLPPIKGDTILQKYSYITDHLDYIRKLVILEPRGHRAMYGTLLVKPDVPEAHLACVFFHNTCLGTMCGHGVIALGRFAIDHGIVKNPTSPETKVVIQCPCGPIDTFVEYENGKTGRTRFHSVPSFVHDLDAVLDLPGFGQIKVDICYGGSFFVILSAASLGLDLKTSSQSELVEAAGLVTETAKKTRKVRHPGGTELEYFSATVLTDGNDTDSSVMTNNMIVFGDRKVDRSPCGSGTTARIAQQFARGLIQTGEQRTFQGPAGATFTGRVVRQLTYDCYDNAVVVEISGRAFYTGTSEYTLEEDDVIGRGFLI